MNVEKIYCMYKQEGIFRNYDVSSANNDVMMKIFDLHYNIKNENLHKLNELEQLIDKMLYVYSKDLIEFVLELTQKKH